MAENKLQPERVAPIFGLLALFFAAAMLSRFDQIAAKIPEAVHGAALMASFPLLLVGGAIERRVDHGARKDFPLWMQIDSRPIRWTFTFALAYLAIVLIQAFDVSVGPIQANPPEAWPQPQRLLWFLMFSFGMSFVILLSATSWLIPILRIVTAPFARLPLVLGMTLLGLLGGGLGWLALQALANQELHQIRGSIDAMLQEPQIMVGVVVASIVVPWLGTLVWKRE